MGTRKLATMMDVAHAAGVSVATVARVIHNNGYVSEEKRELIAQTIRALDYVGAEKEEPEVRSRAIGVLTASDKENPFFAYLPHALAEEANSHHLYVLLQVGEPCGDYLEEMVQGFLQEHVCGIVVVGFQDNTISDENKELLLNCGVPVVFMERTARCYGFNRVLVDGGEGIYMATRHLLELGHRNLVYLRQSSSNDVDEQRMLGYENAMREAGVEHPHALGREGGHIAEGYLAMQECMARWPETTGVVCWSDQYAIGTMKYCAEHGLRIPQDISVTGFDRIYAPVVTPSLTSAEMPVKEMAQAAVEMIIENQNQTLDFYAKTITLSPKLILGDSTGEPRG